MRDRLRWLLVTWATAACSSPAGGGATTPPDSGGGPVDAGPAEAATSPDGGAAPDAGFVEAPHVSLPQVPQNGGPVLAAPQIVTITFAGYPEDATVKGFADWIVGSSWLDAAGKEYGVGHGTHAAHVVLAGPAPAQPSDLDTQALLEQKLQDGTLPTADADAGASGAYLYVLFYPRGTMAGSFLGGPSTCLDEGGGRYLGGYHWETQGGAYHVPYAVVPTCSDANGVEGAADIEISASHEILEASTDPYPYTDVAYDLTDPADPWSYTGGELGDLCEGQTTTDASGYAVQRIWSNAAAKAGAAPCVPAAPGAVLYGTSPSPHATQLVSAGASVTFELTGFSSAPIAPWSIAAFAGEGTFQPVVELAAKTIGNGGTATLKVTVPAGAASQGYADVFVLSARGPDDVNFWPLALTVR